MRRGLRTVLVVHPETEVFGANRLLLESVEGLREAGCRVIIALPAAGPLATELRRTGARVEILPMLVLREQPARPRARAAHARTGLLGLLAGWRLLSRLRPDTVFVSTPDLPYWPLLARFRGIRSVSHLHGSGRSGNRWRIRLLHLPHLASQHVLVSSRGTLETLRWALPTLGRRAEFVHRGVVSPGHPRLPREPLEAPLRLLYVGRLSPHKGPDLALEAAALLEGVGWQVTITLLGTPTDEQAWFAQQLRDQAARSNVEVRFAGFHRDIWPFLAEADLVLVPSRDDGSFGRSALESVLALRPVVVSDSDGLRESVGGYSTTLLVPPDDAQAIADAVIAVADSWSRVVVALSESRETALLRHSPEVYRATIARACGVEGWPRPTATAGP